MKLKSFCLRDYKNITDQTLVFAKGNYTTLVGLNGSGKSNWIEAVANVFCHLYGDRRFEFDFSMLYELDGKTYEFHKLDDDVFVPKDIVIPDRVIACYSGEDIRLWAMSFSNAYDKFFDDLLKGDSEEPEMLYLNRTSWSIALVTLLCSENADVKKFISNIFRICGDIDKQNLWSSTRRCTAASSCAPCISCPSGRRCSDACGRLGCHALSRRACGRSSVSPSGRRGTAPRSPPCR